MNSVLQKSATTSRPEIQLGQLEGLASPLKVLSWLAVGGILSLCLMGLWTWTRVNGEYRPSFP